MPYLSKSKYLVGLQCRKLLWIHYNAKEQLPEADEAIQAVFDQGHEVGLLAQELFPDGITIPSDLSIEDVIKQSLALLKKQKPMFEAGFSFKRTFARVDALSHARGGKWDRVEVKSGTSVKDPNWDDVAFQRYCYEGAGIHINRCYVMHIDNTYVLHGKIEPSKLFVKEDVTEAVKEKAIGLEGRVSEMLGVIGLRKCPQVDIGPHCESPYSCPLGSICWGEVEKVENNIFTLRRAGAKAWSLYQGGIIDNEDIPSDLDLSETQRTRARGGANE